MVEKIQGARLNPKSSAEFNEKIAENINNLEEKFNELIDALRDKDIL